MPVVCFSSCNWRRHEVQASQRPAKCLHRRAARKNSRSPKLGCARLSHEATTLSSAFTPRRLFSKELNRFESMYAVRCDNNYVKVLDIHDVKVHSGGVAAWTIVSTNTKRTAIISCNFERRLFTCDCGVKVQMVTSGKLHPCVQSLPYICTYLYPGSVRPNKLCGFCGR